MRSSILLEMNILGPHPDLVNQKLWEQCPAICVEEALQVVLMHAKV